jgi:hypothetical protein
MFVLYCPERLLPVRIITARQHNTLSMGSFAEAAGLTTDFQRQRSHIKQHQTIILVNDWKRVTKSYKSCQTREQHDKGGQEQS